MTNNEHKDQMQFALAEASIQHEGGNTEGHKTDVQVSDSAPSDVHQTDANTASSHGDAEGGFQFNQLFDQLANHYGFAWGPLHFDLPMIFYDSDEGFSFYSSPTAMEEAGLYTMHHPDHHHHPVKADSGVAPTLDFSITSLLCFQWIAMFVLIIVFAKVGGKYKKNADKAPSGFQNMIESMFIYVRDQMIYPNVGSKRLSNQLMPYFVSLFFFILVINLIGLLPGAHTATGAVGTCAGLAITALFVINISAIKEVGIGAYLKHLLGGAPWWMAPIMIPIEILSMFIKPFALTIRLFANMTAGHVVLLSLVGLIFYFETLVISVISTPFSIFVYFLETLVAFLQAYIFTTLTAIFVGLALGDHAHEHEGAHEAH